MLHNVNYFKIKIFIFLVGTYTNILDAINYCFETHFIPEMKKIDTHQWRISRYYNEFVDNYIKSHLPYLDALYKSWASRKDPGNRE